MANQQDKLYIIISDKPLGGGNGPGTGNKKTKDPSENTNLLGQYIFHETIHLVKENVTKMVNTGISQIGNLTGDYITQQHIQNAISIGTKTLSSTMAVAAATAKFGVPGMIVSAATLAIGSGISLGLQTKIDRIRNNQQNNNINQIRIRAGLDDLYNGGRTGN